jgi:hypothetical protein
MAKPVPKAETHPPESLAPDDSWHYLHLTVGLVAIVGAFCWLQFSTPGLCCGDFDGYYHIKWSQILWKGLRHFNFPPQFEWLPLTTLGPAQYADQHFLFHVLLMPFTWFGDIRLGAKVATALFGSAAVFSLYWLILRYRIRYPLVWLIALLGSGWVFYVRLNMTKAQSISIVFIVAGIILLFERKYMWLAPAAFLYVWTYNLFVMLGVLVVIWVAVIWWSERKLEWRPLLWTAIGMLAGLVVNPFFPHDIALFMQHLAAKSGQVSVQSGVGFEWYPLPSWYFLQCSLIACAATALGYIAFGYLLAVRRHARERLQRPLLLLMFSMFLLLIALRSSRFMEYWPPFAVLFVAFTLESVWEVGTAGLNPLNFDAKGLESNAKHDEEHEEESIAASIPWQVAAIGLLLARTKIVELTVDPDHYRAGAEWMRANIPPGALIYDVNWTDFPKLFFYDTQLSYVSGLDSIYLAARHPELQALTDRLSARSEPDPAGAIRTLFSRASNPSVSYLFVGDTPNPVSAAWFQYVSNGRQFAQVYADSECVILQLLESPQNAPAASTTEEAPIASAPAAGPMVPWNDPRRRKAAAEQVHRRFGGDVFGTVDEKYEGGPALLIHNKQATEEWSQKLFDHDMNSASFEFLWKIGFRTYVVTNEHQGWAVDIDEVPEYRPLFDRPPPPLKP